jgi:hypothetical protein
MRFLSLFILFSSSLYAHEIDVARNCFLDHLKIGNSQAAVMSCTNVASTCYDRFRRYEGIQATRDICFDVN